MNPEQIGLWAGLILSLMPFDGVVVRKMYEAASSDGSYFSLLESRLDSSCMSFME